MLLSKLKNNPSNPRTLSEVDFKKLLNKILVYPRLLEKNKITFDSEQDNTILGGNMRFKTLSHIIKEFANKDISKAIKQAQTALGVDNKDLLNESVDIFSDIIDSKAIPDEWTQDAKGLTAEEKEAFIIIDNVSDGKWDFDILANEWDVDTYDWGLVDWKIEDDNEVELQAKEDDYKEPDELKVDVVLGDLIEIGEHRLLCGDSTDSDQVAKLMNGEKADMVFTDPPYGVEYKGINNDTREGLEDLLTAAFTNYMTNSKQGVSVYCFHSDRSADIFHSVFRYFCHFSSMIIWVKESIVLSRTDYQSKHEPCLYGWFDNGTHSWYSDRKQESVWLAKSKREEGHTTPKPIEIVSKALNNSSLPNHLIFDLFLGSGSTMVAAHQLKRKCYGMELDPKYCQVIIDRMIKLDPSLIVKINGKEYKK